MIYIALLIALAIIGYLIYRYNEKYFLLVLPILLAIAGLSFVYNSGFFTMPGGLNMYVDIISGDFAATGKVNVLWPEGAYCPSGKTPERYVSTYGRLTIYAKIGDKTIWSRTVSDTVYSTSLTLYNKVDKSAVEQAALRYMEENSIYGSVTVNFEAYLFASGRYRCSGETEDRADAKGIRKTLGFTQTVYREKPSVPKEEEKKYWNVEVVNYEVRGDLEPGKWVDVYVTLRNTGNTQTEDLYIEVGIIPKELATEWGFHTTYVPVEQCCPDNDNIYGYAFYIFPNDKLTIKFRVKVPEEGQVDKCNPNIVYGKYPGKFVIYYVIKRKGNIRDSSKPWWCYPNGIVYKLGILKEFYVEKRYWEVKVVSTEVSGDWYPGGELTVKLTLKNVGNTKTEELYAEVGVLPLDVAKEWGFGTYYATEQCCPEAKNIKGYRVVLEPGEEDTITFKITLPKYMEKNPCGTEIFGKYPGTFVVYYVIKKKGDIRDPSKPWYCYPNGEVYKLGKIEQRYVEYKPTITVKHDMRFVAAALVGALLVILSTLALMRK